MASEQSGRTTANGIIDDPTDAAAAAAVVCHGMDGGAVKLFVKLCTAQVTLHGWPDAAGHNKLCVCVCVCVFFTEHAKHEETMHHDSTQSHAA
jgi:hypothetical protein